MTTKPGPKFFPLVLAMAMGGILLSMHLGGAAVMPTGPAAPLSPAQQSRLTEDFGRLPLYFVENLGQVDKRVRFYHEGPGQGIWFTAEGISFTCNRGRDKTAFPGKSITASGIKKQPAREAQGSDSRPALIRLTPLGMSPQVKLMALEAQAGKVNYLRVADPRQWRTNLATYQAVAYREAYPGIDLKFYGTNREVEYDILVKPGADPSQVKFQYRDIAGLEVTPGGELGIHLRDGGTLIQKKPVVYQEIAGQRLAREGRFKVYPDQVYGIEVAAYDPGHPLIIDPVLIFSTYLGGGDWDGSHGIAADQAGNVYITGGTNSSDFPAPSTIYPKKTAHDVFVTKISSSGKNLIYSTFLGGSGEDWGQAIVVDDGGNAYITGHTESADFPMQTAIYPNYQGGTGGDAFVAKLNPTGTALVYSTYLGGTGSDEGTGIAVDQAHNVYVTGWTDSGDFLTSKTPLYSYQGKEDAFIAKINPGGTDLAYFTFLGGSGDDWANAIAVDKNGNAYITGGTESSSFPVASSLYPFKGVYDAFVAKINSGGTALAYFTYLGGSQWDEGAGIAVDSAGNAYVTGPTLSANFPTEKPFSAQLKGTSDAFVSKINPTGTSLVYSTYLGGSGEEWDFFNWGYGAIAVDATGKAYVTGSTTSSDFPAKRANYAALKGVRNAFITVLDTSGTSLVYSTYLGGSGTDVGNAIAVDPRGNIYVAGYTESANFPTKNPLYGQLQGPRDAFVAKIKLTSNLPHLLLLVGD